MFSTSEQAHVTFSYASRGSFVSTENLIKIKV
jgi:hypothetical protein